MNHALLDPDAEPIFPTTDIDRLAALKALEQKVLWLSVWIIHHANHLRSSDGELKVGGHQASSASMVTLMSALYFSTLRPHDRVAVKPHGSPVFHAIQYLLGNQTREQLAGFRALGGAQSYPSRTKDVDDVDFSTGSVGLGVAMTSFAALVQDYLDAHGWATERGRMVAVVGDAELDEGNIYEALLEGWKHDVRDLWWVIDYNRQSLDAVISDRLLNRFSRLFNSMGWRVVTVKYGRLLQAAYARPGGEALRQWIDACPNTQYSALVYKGGAAWRERLLDDIGARSGVQQLIGHYDDEALHTLMTNLGGHCMESMLEAFEAITDDQPTCFFAYTIKGHGLPLAGHKDNHAGLMTPEQVDTMRQQHGITEGAEWEPFEGLPIADTLLQRFVEHIPFNTKKARRHQSKPIPVPETLKIPGSQRTSTQEAFGRILDGIARANGPLAERIVTTSPDVTVSTNLGGWVNRRGLFHRSTSTQHDLFSEGEVNSLRQWQSSPKGQHLELGIAENNLFILLAAAGLSHSLFGERLLPIGTLYDPFIDRGLDALNYACYQDARFILVATPSGISLAPEGGAHQSSATPLLGMAKPGLSAFEPAYADELAVILRWSFEHLQAEEKTLEPGDLLGDQRGGSVYLRLSTRRIDQRERPLDTGLADQIIEGGYWLCPPANGASLVIAYMGVMAPQALEAHKAMTAHEPGAGLLAVTSADRLHRGWLAAQRARQVGERETTAAIERLLEPLAGNARLVTVSDSHPAVLSWLGAVRGQRVNALGVEQFGQSGTLSELYETYQLDVASIVQACQRRN